MTSESYDVAPNPNKHKKLLYGSIAIAVIGVAVLIAGAVMLGIGIHKANKKSSTDNAPAPAGTTAVPSSTLPSGGSTPANGGSTQPGGSTAPVTTTAAPGPPIPDPYWADTLIAFDASFNLLNETEKKLVDGLIIGPNTTRFETIAVLSYAANMSCIVPFGNIKSYGDFQTALASLSQFNAAGSISSGMATIAQNLRSHPSVYLNTVFFTSTSDDTDVASAKHDALLLQDEGSLVVVAVGSADATKLTPLTNGNASDVIQIPTAGNVDYATYAQQIKNQFYVPPVPTTTTASPTTVTTTTPTAPISGTTVTTTTPTAPVSGTTVSVTSGPTTTVTTKRTPLPVHTTATHNVPTTTNPSTTSAPYIPCQSQIAVITDATAGISAAGFAKQQAFITSILSTNINHYERVTYAATFGPTPGTNDVIVPIDSGTTLQQIKDGITNTKQTSEKFGLLPSITVIITELSNPLMVEAAIIFVSDTSDADDIRRALSRYEAVDSAGNFRLTFVLTAANANAAALAGFNATIVAWTDFATDQPDGWDATKAFGCSGATTPTTTRSPITVHTTVTHNPGTTTTPGRTPLPVHTTATHNPVTTTTTVTTTARTPLPVHTTATHNPVTTPVTIPSTVTTKRTPLPVHTTATHNPVTTTAQPVVTTPAPYLPCKTQITFISDVSNTLTPDQFKIQLAFISTIIGNINYPARIGYGYANADVVSYGTSYTIAQIQSFVTTTNQTTSTYDLHNALRPALTNAGSLDLPYDPQAVVVFISDTSNAAKAASFVKQLTDAHVKVTFVLLGSKATADDVSTLSKNTISWTDLTKPQPESWDNGTASTAYNCDANSYKSNSIYRFFAKPDTPTPCSSQVVFSADISSTLTSTQFQTQLSFVSSAIAGFSDLSRIAYSYDRNLPIPFGGQFNLTQIQQIVSTTAQIGGAYSLRNTLRAAVSAAIAPVDAYSPVAIAVFTSDTSNTGGIAQFLQTIQDNNIVLTLILMGDKASAADLADFNINTVTWKDLAQAQPDNWNASAPIVYACESAPTTTRGPITVHTTVTHNVPTTTTTRAPLTVHTTVTHNVPTTTRAPLTIHTTATHNVPTTTTTNRQPITVHTTVTHNAPTTTRAPLTIHTTATHNVPTTTPNPGSYQPCRTQIIFALDDTNLQSDAILSAQKAFLSKAIGAINFPDRLALIRGGSTVISYFNQNTTADFQNAINATQNSGSDFVLRAALLPTVIAGAFPEFSNAPQAVVVFVSNTSPSSIAGSEAYIAALKFFQVKVTLVVYGPNANAADVANLGVTTINWADPTTQAAPDNWDTISSSVYGCDSGGFRY